MKYDKFFSLAKEAGIEEAELSISESSNLSFSLFHSEVDSYESNNSMNIKARGIINGKFGTAACDTWSKEKCEYLVKEIKENALVVENDDPAIIFEGSEKYHKINTYNNDLANIPFEEKLNALLKLESLIRAKDSRIVEIEAVAYEEKHSKSTLMNSKGLKLHSNNNHFVIYGAAVASENGQVKSDYDLFFDNDFSKLDVEKLATKVVNKVTSQLGGEACESMKCKAVLAPNVVTSLLHPYINHASSDEVQKNASLFIGKVGQKIASSKVTIEDRPLEKTLFARGFDDEGVATYNKSIIKNGVLQGYLYNLKTAAKENRESTGNGFNSGAAIGIGTTFLYLKPGNKSQEELFNMVGNGVYITDVAGLHSGLNEQSGNFSLQSSGFLIKDGKKDRGLDIITISGNLLQLFSDVLEVGSDTEISPSGVSSQSILIKEISVSGK